MTNEKIRYQGIITYQKYDYGFIKCDKLEENTFYHISNTIPSEQIHRGDRVSFEIGEGRYGKTQAINVRLLRDGENYVVKDED
jgi:cold shock CspA family protein